MGINKYRCEQCGQPFYRENASFDWRDGDNSKVKHQAEISGIHEGTYNSRFCSKSCAKAWVAAHPGKSPHTLGERIVLAIIMAPIKLLLLACKLILKIAKQILKLTWLACKQILKIAKKILRSKWTWTICTCGMAWAAWKMLNAIYAPKK